MIRQLLSLLLFSCITSFAQVNWSKHVANPVLGLGQSGSWDATNVSPNFVIFKDGIYYLWYDGINSVNERNVGLATSTDGISWTRYQHNPVFPVGSNSSWDDFRVVMGSILIKDTVYHMWYSGNDGSRVGSYYSNKIGYATSTDGGISWARYSDPVVEPGSAGEWDDYSVFAPWVIFDRDTFKMWYDGFRTNSDGIGYAWSLDGINWTKHNNPNTSNHPFAESDPVVLPTQGWESGYLSSPSVMKINDQFEMWYTGYSNPYGATGYATSVDGINWNKYGGNPVLRVGPPGSWDDRGAFMGRVILTDNVYRMWYAGWDGSVEKIGYAFDSTLVTAMKELVTDIPELFLLYQNHPNPFNPSTTINYAIPRVSTVSIKVLDVLGNEIETLVNEEKSPGRYETTWHADNLPSGVYFYRLNAGNFTETKKMLLLK